MDRLSLRTAPGPRRPSEYRPLIMNRSRSESALLGEAGVVLMADGFVWKPSE